MNGKPKTKSAPKIIACPRVTLPDITAFDCGEVRFIIDYRQVCRACIPWLGHPPKKLTMHDQVYKVVDSVPFKMPFDSTLCGGCPDQILEKIISHFVITYRDNRGCEFKWSASECEDMIIISQSCAEC